MHGSSNEEYLENEKCAPNVANWPQCAQNAESTEKWFAECGGFASGSDSEDVHPHIVGKHRGCCCSDSDSIG